MFPPEDVPRLQVVLASVKQQSVQRARGAGVSGLPPGTSLKTQKDSPKGQVCSVTVLREELKLVARKETHVSERDLTEGTYSAHLGEGRVLQARLVPLPRAG